MRVDKVIVVVVLMAVVLPAAAERQRALDDEDEDEDSDPAPFMIMLEHDSGWRCAASLVSIRTGVTTSRCARGGGMAIDETPTREIWAFAAAMVSARSSASPAAAARRVARVAFAGDGRDAADPALDIAVVELEAPFGGAAHSRPILMATSGGGCERASVCHAIRALAPVEARSDNGRRARYRVVNLSTVSDKRCANLVPHWAASRKRLICLAGDKLCERDLGGGVVCGGKLCGVLSAAAGEAREARCGDTFAAQSVARWRRFLHCAHTLRLCGRGACQELCTERQLLKDIDEDKHSNLSLSTEADTLSSLMESTHKSITTTDDWTSSVPTRSNAAPHRTPPSPRHTRPSPTRSTLAFIVDDPSLSPRPAFEFEPNRPDFRAVQTRTSRMGLKAGEYGDNVAEYGEEGPPPRTAAATAVRRTTTRAASPTAPVPPAPALQLATTPRLSNAHMQRKITIQNRILLFCIIKLFE